MCRRCVLRTAYVLLYFTIFHVLWKFTRKVNGACSPEKIRPRPVWLSFHQLVNCFTCFLSMSTRLACFTEWHHSPLELKIHEFQWILWSAHAPGVSDFYSAQISKKLKRRICRRGQLALDLYQKNLFLFEIMNGKIDKPEHQFSIHSTIPHMNAGYIQSLLK